MVRKNNIRFSKTGELGKGGARCLLSLFTPVENLHKYMKLLEILLNKNWGHWQTGDKGMFPQYNYLKSLEK